MAAKVPDLQRAIEMISGTSRYKTDGLPVRALPNLYNQKKLKMDYQEAESSHRNKKS